MSDPVDAAAAGRVDRPRTTAPTCSDLRVRLGVDTAGTASEIRSWLLLERPGTWPEGVRDAAFAAALPRGRHGLLEQLAEEQQLRPLLVRRPGRAGRRSVEEPALLVGSTAGGRRWLERLPARALPDVDLEALAAGRPGHGEPVEGPLFAVCTNGSRDRCCAVRGRPLVDALAAAHPDRTWEVTHVGGCRFAANLLVLPDGVVHGGTTPEDGLRIAAAAVLDGRMDLAGLRGRTGTSGSAGAAEVALRRSLGLDRPADVEVLAEHPHGDAGADVVLRAGDDVWRAVVRAVDLGVHPTVCHGDEEFTATRVRSLVRDPRPATPHRP